LTTKDTTKKQRKVKAMNARSRHLFTTSLVLAVIALSITIMGTLSSGAKFSNASRNPGAAFTGGNMTLVNSKDGSAVLNTSGLAPGASVNGTLTLTNQGNLAAGVTLTRTALTDMPSGAGLSSVLALTVADITGTTQTLYNGTMSDFASVAISPFAAGETRTYRFTVAFPAAGAASSQQNASTSMTVLFTGVAQ
jgi:hypothetical protein